MKKRLLVLLAGILPLLVGNVMGQTFHNFTEETIVSLTKTNIEASDYITWSVTNYATNKTYCGETGDFPNMSGANRALTFTVKNVESFSISVQNTNGGRTYTVKIGNADIQTVTHEGTGCEAELFTTNTLEEITIIIAGGGESVYPASITFYPPTGPSKDATLSSVTVNGEDAAIAEGGTEDYNYSYTLPFDYNEATATVAATATSDKAVISIPNEGSITTPAVGNYTDVTISVTPETGAADAKEYIVRVFRQASANNDNSIATLTVDEKVLTADEETGIYSFEIPYAYEGNPTITVTLTDEEYATYTISEFDASTIAGGSSIDVTIKVTAQNGVEANYTLTISRVPVSTACELISFHINGFKGEISGTDVALKVMSGYDFSNTPVIVVSEFATGVWNQEEKTIVVTAQDATTTATYTIAASDITPLAAFPYEATFGTEYTVPEWMWGSNYNSGLRLPGAGNSGEIVGGIDIASDNAANQATGTNKLNLYLSSCESITLNVGATGGRTLSCVVDGVELSQTEAIKSNEAPKDVTFTINKSEPTHVYFIAKASNGGTRVYNIKITQGSGTNVEQSEADSTLKYWSTNGILYLQADKAQAIKLYNIDGSLVKSELLNEGLTEITGLQKGIYLLNNAKVIIK